MDNIAGIVLAAGEGKRFGGTKALAEFDGMSFLERVSESLKHAGCAPVIVVGGADSSAVEKLCSDLDVDFVENPDWQAGQFSSLKAGLSSLKTRPAGVLIALVDHPFIEITTYVHLLEASRAHLESIIIPVYNCKRGHPVIIPMAIGDEIIVSPDSSNLREIIKKHNELVVELPVDDSGILKDIDTAADLSVKRSNEPYGPTERI